MNNLQETVGVLTLEGEVSVEQIGWSQDGQLLAASTRNGNIRIFLTRLTQLSASFGTHIALLSSLNEVTLYDCHFDKVRHSALTEKMLMDSATWSSFLAMNFSPLKPSRVPRLFIANASRKLNVHAGLPLLVHKLPAVKFDKVANLWDH